MTTDRQEWRRKKTAWARESRDAGLAPFTDEAEWLSWLVSGMKLGWIADNGDVHVPRTAHGEHIYESSCAICKAGDAPGALRVVIDAILAAHYDDEARALEVARLDA